MLDSLLIENFKSISDCRLEFGRMNVFIGDNGSGKSNLLEAIGLYCACLGESIGPAALSTKGVRLSAGGRFHSAFRNEGRRTGITLTGALGEVMYSAALRAAAADSRLEFSQERLDYRERRVLTRKGRRVELTNDDGERRQVEMTTGGREGVRAAHGAGSALPTTVQAALRQMGQYRAYGWEHGLSTGDENDRDPENRGSGAEAGEGTLALKFMTKLLGDPASPPAFGIDNIDRDLDARSARRVFEAIREKLESDEPTGRGLQQVFAATHKPTAIDAIDLFDAGQRLFLVSRNEAGHTQVKRIAPAVGTEKEDWISLTGGRNLSQLWLEGRLTPATTRK